MDSGSIAYARRQIIAVAEDGLQVGEIAEFLEDRTAEPIPATVSTLQSNLEQRTGRLRDKGTVHMTVCADAETARLLALDPKLKKTSRSDQEATRAVGTEIATPLVVEVQQLEIREHYIAILDCYHDFAVVTVIELVSPSNKAAGPGRESYLNKQREIQKSECHLVEIDLQCRGSHVMSVPETHLGLAKPFDCLVCVNRWPARSRFELYPCRLRESLPTIGIPLADPDLDAPLAIENALEAVSIEGDFMLRVRYDEPCNPPLSAEDQKWATERWSAYRQAHPDLFPEVNGR